MSIENWDGGETYDASGTDIGSGTLTDSTYYGSASASQHDTESYYGDQSSTAAYNPTATTATQTNYDEVEDSDETHDSQCSIS